MPKRSSEAKIQYYEAKLQKLQEKQKATPPAVRRRCIVYSDSSTDDNSGKSRSLLITNSVC